MLLIETRFGIQLGQNLVNRVYIQHRLYYRLQRVFYRERYSYSTQPCATVCIMHKL